MQSQMSSLLDMKINSDLLHSMWNMQLMKIVILVSNFPMIKANMNFEHCVHCLLKQYGLSLSPVISRCDPENIPYHFFWKNPYPRCSNMIISLFHKIVNKFPC